MIELRPLLNNKTSSLFDPHLEHLNKKIELTSAKLGIFESTRNKRGLIDGLGSVIKSISGNLDYTDALKYENAIKTLRNNEQKLESEINNHISLNKGFISQSSKIIDSIVINQNEMKKTLNLILEADINRETDLMKYAHLAQHLLILGDNVEDLLEELQGLENTLTFIRASSTPYSIFSLNEVKDMLSKLRILYSNNEILDIDFRNFYEITKLGYFYLNRQIVIVIKVPVVVPLPYDLYKLCLVPNRNQEVLIPPLPFVALSRKDSRYIETECPKVNSLYLCQSKTNLGIQGKPDCIQHLIAHQELQPNCNPTPITLKNEALEVLDDKHYTMSFPVPTKVKISCGQEQYRTLMGSYLVIIPLNCNIRTPAFTITNSNDHIKGHIIRITEIPLFNESKTLITPRIIFSSPSLQRLHTLNNEIATELPIHTDDITNPAIYHTTIPVYLILLGASVLIAIHSYRRLCNKTLRKDTKPTEAHNASSELSYAVPESRRVNPSQVRVENGWVPATTSDKPCSSRYSSGGGVTHEQLK